MDVNGKQFFLVDVIAHVLHHFKNQLLTVLRDFGYRNIKASMFNWVITLPAIWGSSAWEMMREAGYMVSPKLKCNHHHQRKLEMHTYTCTLY